MQENQVSIERITHPLPSPFMVIASQLPYGGAGTYPLSEVQIDRFMLRAWSTYPSREEEKQIVAKTDYREEVKIQPVVTLSEIAEIRRLVKEIYISEKVEDYIVTLIEHIRHNPDVLIAPSPRASISLYKGSRVMALLNERDFVIPDDVKKLFLPAIEHRIRIKPEAEMEEVTHRAIVEKALEEVPVPKM
jgi:MoxR-like ATPase